MELCPWCNYEMTPPEFIVVDALFCKNKECDLSFKKKNKYYFYGGLLSGANFTIKQIKSLKKLKGFM